MTTHEPTRDPLDEEEREFSRIIRALPGGEPSPALDARILGAAQDAVAAAPRRRVRPWAAGGALWGIGTAAAAVLAIGVSWHVMNPQSDQLPVPAPSASSASSADQEDSGVPVEFKIEAPREYDNSPPPTLPAAATAASTRADKPAPPPMAQAPAAPPPPPMPTPFIDEHVANANDQATDAVASDSQREIARASRAAAPAPVAAAAASAGNAAPAMAKAEQADAREPQTAGQLSASAEAGASVAAPAKPDDFRGKPATWLKHIRELNAAHDAVNAKLALRQFIKRYPHYPIPSDLAPLLRE